MPVNYKTDPVHGLTWILITRESDDVRSHFKENREDKNIKDKMVKVGIPAEYLKTYVSLLNPRF
jgi:hypothetical protein